MSGMGTFYSDSLKCLAHLAGIASSQGSWKFFLQATEDFGGSHQSPFLQLKLEHSLTFKTLKRKEGKPPHKDPFDNLMLAQAVAEDMTFITHDEHIAEYDSKNIFKV